MKSWDQVNEAKNAAAAGQKSLMMARSVDGTPNPVRLASARRCFLTAAKLLAPECEKHDQVARGRASP